MKKNSGNAATKAKNKYNSNNYDRLNVVVPKGCKTEILAVAEAGGDSLNAYIIGAIDERMYRDKRAVSKKYTIIGGVNGTGKSSFTGALKTQTIDLGEIIDVDKITSVAGVSPLEGGKIAINRITDCLKNEISFTQETTLSGHKTQLTAKKAKESGYYITMFYIGLDTVDESLRRIANRVKRGGHAIGEDDVRRRFKERWNAVLKILPYCDKAFFFDNDNGFVEVTEYKNGKFSKKGELQPKWILELIDCHNRLSIEAKL